MATAIRCTLPSCTCDCFAPGKTQIRTCDQCKHGWAAHALDKLTATSLLPSIQVEVVHPNLVFDLASLVLYGTQAVPIRLKIVLDRLFSVLQEDEVTNILDGFGWTKEDYARGYIVQGPDGKVLSKWTCVLESEEGAIFNQFLRFGETRSIVEMMIQDLQNQRNTPVHVATTESNIRAFIERMSHTNCQESSQSISVNSTQCAKNRDEGNYNHSHISNPSQHVPSSSQSKVQTDGQTVNQYGALINPKRRKNNSKQANLSVPSIHLANLERTVLNAGAEPTITSTRTVPASLNASSGSVSGHIQHSVPQLRKRTTLSSVKGPHRSMFPRRRTKSAFTISANRKRVRCNVCNKWFYDKGTWKIHYSAVHLKVTYRCKVEGCNMVFSSLRSRNRHSGNPNPKIHRIMGDGQAMYDQTQGFQKIAVEWKDTPIDGDTEAENNNTQCNIKEEPINDRSQIDESLQESVDSDLSIIKLSVNHSEDLSRQTQNDEDKSSPSKPLLISPRLSVIDSATNTRAQKRKSNTPVRCLAVDDEGVNNHGDSSVSDSTSKSTTNDPENIAPLLKLPEEAPVVQDSMVDNDSISNNAVVYNINTVTKDEIPGFDSNVIHPQESVVIPPTVIKSEYVTNSVPHLNEEDDTKISNPNSYCDKNNDDIPRGGDSLHPNVPLELAGFSPSIDQTGLNVDNCFFTLDGFPTCILCQKSFQSRQGVRVHYQNVHLRMMHMCTIEGCHAAFPSRRSRDRHSANNNLHRTIYETTSNTHSCHGDGSDHEMSESSFRQSLETTQSSSDTSGSETNDQVKNESDVEVNSPLKNSNLSPVLQPKVNVIPVSRPVQLHNNSSQPEGAHVSVKASSSQCLPFDSPTLVPPCHSTGKLSMADLWTGPRKSHGGLVCDICMKSYSTKDTLRTHYKNVHIREMHKCTVVGCDMMFSSVRSRNRHSQNPNLHRSFQDSVSDS